jgi:uncharacterized membrane protein
MTPVVRENAVWMTANVFLALVPVALALFLFVPQRRRTAAWWIGVGAFVAFLPNAPYVLTDVVHLAHQARLARTDEEVLALLAEYALLMGAGLAAYGLSIYVLRRRLTEDGAGRWRWPVELALHGLCAVGIFLGRFMRLNSWDVLVRPGTVLQYVRIPHAGTVEVITVLFGVLVAATLALRLPIAIHDLRRSSR